MKDQEEVKRWTAKRKSALVLEIIQGKTTVSEASRAYDLMPSEIECWVEEGKRGMENALRAKPEDAALRHLIVVPAHASKIANAYRRWSVNCGVRKRPWQRRQRCWCYQKNSRR